MQQLEVAGNIKVLERLEVIRQLNAKREWINNRLYGLTTREDLLIVAYERLKSQPGNMTSGSDNQTLDGFSMKTVKELSEQLRTEKYQPRPIRTSYIPKANGKMRKLGMPCPKDKVVQEVVRMILEAVYDSPHGAYFDDSSHGFRRTRSCHTALQEVQRKWSGVTWIVEGDISQCFDDIDHEVLIRILRKKIRDAFSKSKEVDLVRMSTRLRTRSKLGLACCICGKTESIDMHHIRHVRKMSDKKAKGFIKLMAILNRKQVPVCRQCHLGIHSGKYDGLKLEDLAYDPRKPKG